MFKMTETAANQVRAAAKQGGTEGMALRMAARKKEDGSFDYLMGFDQLKDEDLRFTSQGVDVIMAPEYAPLLEETIMDYVEMEEGDFRFIFLNPKDANYTPPSEL
jgi:iron-sulfur cluster assembly protein